MIAETKSKEWMSFLNWKSIYKTVLNDIKLNYQVIIAICFHDFIFNYRVFTPNNILRFVALIKRIQKNHTRDRFETMVSNNYNHAVG